MPLSPSRVGGGEGGEDDDNGEAVDKSGLGLVALVGDVALHAVIVINPLTTS